MILATVCAIWVNPSRNLSFCLVLWVAVLFEVVCTQILVGLSLWVGKEKWREWEKENHAMEIHRPLEAILEHIFFEKTLQGPRLISLSSGISSTTREMWEGLCKVMNHSRIYVPPPSRNSFLGMFFLSFYHPIPLFIFPTLVLQRFLFKLQYKAIIKPERLVGLPTQAPEAKG
jgi:hypothetical protein